VAGSPKLALVVKDLNDILRAELDVLDKGHLRRTLRAIDEQPAGMLNFAANDYLGLARHPKLIEAAREATARRGTGSGASRLVTGTDTGVASLERELAAWKEKDAALVFSSGFAAALGTIPVLVGRGDTVILDKLSHASLIDAARLSGATLRTFPHNDVARLGVLLEKICTSSSRTLVVTESVFSMDGDLAPLREIVELKERHGAWLLVDEAHATGLYGATGAGVIAEAGLSARVEIVLGTLSKALGSVGGYIAGSRELVDWLINRARSFIYSTALPPGTVAASRAALAVARSAEGAGLRGRHGKAKRPPQAPSSRSSAAGPRRRSTWRHGCASGVFSSRRFVIQRFLGMGRGCASLSAPPTRTRRLTRSSPLLPRSTLFEQPRCSRVKQGKPGRIVVRSP
jgi:8-amino-7-oxononanoate synthase